MMRRLPTSALSLPVAVLLAAASSCASPPVMQPGMQAGYSVDCSGADQAWEDCYKKAQRSCAHGYDVLSQSSQQVNGMGRDTQQPYGGNRTYRTLMVACREPEEGT
ncbi:MAG TPA: hypothetical protein VF651_01350 [Gammaproteobacteria bacterium]